MDLTLTRFVHALRSAELPVSPAETLDGFEVVQAIGISDPQLLEDALALTLAKTREEKERFALCFQKFFHQLAFAQPAKRSMLKDVSREGLLASVETLQSQPLTRLVADIFDGDRSSLALRVQEEAGKLNLSGMRSLRDKSGIIADLLRALGSQELESLLSRDDDQLKAYLPALRYLRQYLVEQVHDYVDSQYQLQVDATGKRALLESALKSNFAALPPDYFADVDRVVAKLAQRLAGQHRRRRKRAQRGVLDLKATMRDNIAYDGALFKLHWRRKRIEKSSVFVVCDVSNSVAATARFLLLFLHGLADVLPEVRAFAFSNRLGEITDLLRRHEVERAVEEALFDWGKGTTDYGRALVDFRDLVHTDLDHRSTVVFLGDARGNYFAPRTDVLKEISARVKQIFWLNPESPESWGEGDSEMKRYAAYCLRVDVCRDLQQIERFADRLLTATR